MLKKTVKLKTEWGDDANMYLQLITYTIKCSNSLQAMTAPLRKIGKKKGHFWMFGWWVWFFTHWSAATALVEKDEANRFHRWPQYNALPGRVKGRYSFRDPNKVQLVSYSKQIFFWKPNSREINVLPLCEMSCRQPVRWARGRNYMEWSVRSSSTKRRMDTFDPDYKNLHSHRLLETWIRR